MKRRRIKKQALIASGISKRKEEMSSSLRQLLYMSYWEFHFEADTCAFILRDKHNCAIGIYGRVRDTNDYAFVFTNKRLFAPFASPMLDTSLGNMISGYFSIPVHRFNEPGHMRSIIRVYQWSPMTRYLDLDDWFSLTSL